MAVKTSSAPRNARGAGSDGLLLKPPSRCPRLIVCLGQLRTQALQFVCLEPLPQFQSPRAGFGSHQISPYLLDDFMLALAGGINGFNCIGPLTLGHAVEACPSLCRTAVCFAFHDCTAITLWNKRLFCSLILRSAFFRDVALSLGPYTMSSVSFTKRFIASCINAQNTFLNGLSVVRGRMGGNAPVRPC